MSGQNGARAAIIGILVIGFSVTRMTKNFVSEEGRLATGGAPPPAVQSSVNEDFEPKQITKAGSGAIDAGAPKSAEAAETDFAEAGENVWEEAQETASVTVNIAGADSVETDIAEAELTVSETVKSPLETAEESGAALEVRLFYESVSARELSERLSQTESQAAQYKEMAEASNPDRSVSVYISAEYEKDLWNYELELICSCIRVRLPEADSEHLRQEEMKWLKQRDLAADKAAAEKKNSSSMEAAWSEEAARMTKQRCYELLADYEDLLDGTEKPENTENTENIQENGIRDVGLSVP